MSKAISLIAAVSRNGYIGREGDLPWHLRDDLRWFMRETLKHTVIMGRRTFESLARPLPNRQNIVLTRDDTWASEGVLRASSIEQAIQLATRRRIYVAGGEMIYRAALPYVSQMVITHVLADVEGDARFPEFESSRWTSVLVHRQRKNRDNEFDFEISKYVPNYASHEAMTLSG